MHLPATYYVETYRMCTRSRRDCGHICVSNAQLCSLCLVSAVGSTNIMNLKLQLIIFLSDISLSCELILLKGGKLV